MSKSAFLFDGHKVDSQQFLRPEDGRKARHKASKRRTLWLELASFGDAYGRSVFPSNKTLAERLLWSEPTVERFMRDLKKMGFVVNETRAHCFHSRMIRHLALPSDSTNSAPLPSDSLSVPSVNDGSLPSHSSPLPSPNDGPLPSANDGVSAQGTAHQPSAQPTSGGMGGRSEPIGADKKNRLVPFRPETLRREWQRTYVETRKDYIENVSDNADSEIPRGLLLNGFEKVVSALRAYDNGVFYEWEQRNGDRTLDSVDILSGDGYVDGPFADWLKERYFPSFETAFRIQVPLTNFAKDISGLLDEVGTELHKIEEQFKKQDCESKISLPAR
jgi:hypothetical protein